MQKNSRSLSQLTDAQLLVEVKALAANEREATAQLIASLAELDARRLYLGEGYSSLFTYCTQSLHLSEHAAYNRIEAARVARKWPVILDLLVEGSLTLTTARLLAPHLTDENHREVFEMARHKSKRDIEHLVAALHLRPDVPATVRKLPSPRMVEIPTDASTAPPLGPLVSPARGPGTTSSSQSPALLSPVAVPISRPAVVVPLAPERYKVQMTVSRQTHDKLRRAQDLLRHSVPNEIPPRSSTAP